MVTIFLWDQKPAISHSFATRMIIFVAFVHTNQVKI